MWTQAFPRSARRPRALPGIARKRRYNCTGHLERSPGLQQPTFECGSPKHPDGSRYQNVWAARVTDMLRLRAAATVVLGLTCTDCAPPSRSWSDPAPPSFWSRWSRSRASRSFRAPSRRRLVRHVSAGQSAGTAGRHSRGDPRAAQRRAAKRVPPGAGAFGVVGRGLAAESRVRVPGLATP